MPVIEGVGDEVFQVLMIALVVLLGVVGWWSTSISEQPLIRTVLILEPRHHTAPENTTNVITPSPPEDTGQLDPTTSEVHAEVAAVPDTSSGTSKNESQTGQGASPEQQPQATAGTDPCSSSSSHIPDAEVQGGSNGSADAEVDTDISADANANATEPSAEISSSADQQEAPGVSSTANELRKRRLQFFGDRQGTDNTVNTCLTQTDDHLNSSHDCTNSSSTENNDQGTSTQDSQSEVESSSSDPCPACDDIRVKLKFLNDNQKLVQGKLQEPLGDFKRRNFAVEIAACKVIRLIFNGQVLQSDERTLQNYGLFDNCVVHCLVHNQRTPNPNVENASTGNTGEDLHFGGADVGDTREWDMSNVMYISMFVILSAIWYLRINFSQLFSATSTVALFGLSGIFVIFLVGMYIPDQEVIRT